ncbi:hypothetical protein C8R45DRAFT_1014499 [Mycena sanguinolenta]|nr:hypothetical protein C8R45DRAFT_1014499 [Mycena sanguinolenta]
MQDISTIVSANLATIILQSFLYGFLVLLFIVTIYFLATRRTLGGTSRTIRRNFTSPVFLGVTALFLATTTYWCIVIYQAFFAFLQLGTLATEDAFYKDIGQPTEMTKMFITYLSVLLADGLVVRDGNLFVRRNSQLVPETYRLWIIWGRNRKVVIFPIFALIGWGVTFTRIFAEVAKIGGRALFATDSVPWEATGFVLSLSANLYSTGCIAWKVTTTKAAPESRLTWFLAILVESAALQTLWLTFTMMILLFKSELSFVADENLSFILAISNTLIHVRVGLGWSHDSVLAYKSNSTKLGENTV